MCLHISKIHVTLDLIKYHIVDFDPNPQHHIVDFDPKSSQFCILS